VRSPHTCTVHTGPTEPHLQGRDPAADRKLKRPGKRPHCDRDALVIAARALLLLACCCCRDLTWSPEAPWAPRQHRSCCDAIILTTLLERLSVVTGWGIAQLSSISGVLQTHSSVLARHLNPCSIIRLRLDLSKICGPTQSAERKHRTLAGHCVQATLPFTNVQELLIAAASWPANQVNQKSTRFETWCSAEQGYGVCVAYHLLGVDIIIWLTCGTSCASRQRDTWQMFAAGVLHVSFLREALAEHW
jgi:hypothetical protein